MIYFTAYMSRSQKFDTKAQTDDRGEVKVELKTAFETVTIGLSKDQAEKVKNAISGQLLGDREPPVDDEL